MFELLLVVSIVALISAFVVPTYQLLLAEQQLTTAAEQAADFTRLAAQRTVTEQQVYGVRGAAGGTVLTLYRLSGTTEVSVQTLSLPSVVEISAVNFAGSATVRFASSGAPSASGTITLRDTTRNRYRDVEVRPSGIVQVGGSER
jgi:Tfp pilus assembly protein FimT